MARINTRHHLPARDHVVSEMVHAQEDPLHLRPRSMHTVCISTPRGIAPHMDSVAGPVGNRPLPEIIKVYKKETAHGTLELVGLS